MMCYYFHTSVMFISFINVRAVNKPDEKVTEKNVGANLSSRFLTESTGLFVYEALV